MLVKDFRLRGMDLRSSDIKRAPEYASDIVNMEPDGSGDWVKRRGFTDELTSVNAIDVREYKKGSEKVFLSPTLLSKFDGSTVTNINLAGTLPISGWSVQPSWEEYNGILYWTDPTGNTDLFKYDGYMAYRAGMPKVNATIASGAGIFFRTAYQHIDMQGQIIWGDYTQSIEATAGSLLTVDTLNGTEFPSKHGRVSGPQTINSGNLILSVLSGHNYVVGDWVRCLNSDLEYIPLEVSSSGSTSIGLSAASVSTHTFNFSGAAPVERRLQVTVWSSNNLNFGYTRQGTYAIDINAASTTLNTFNYEVANTPMEDDYDTIKTKGLPPRFKYISIYNNVMVGANQSITNAFNTDPLDTTPRDEDTFYWSDLGVGSTVETFAPDDKQEVGKTSEGNITGVFSSVDSMIIFKEKQVYYLNGILTGRLFRMRSAQTNKIGCTSHRSVQEFGGGCIFMSRRGVYFIRNGESPTEMSDIVEKYFTEDTTSLDFSTSVTVLSEKDEKCYIYTESTASESQDSVICYDYKYQDWFKYDSIPARGGFTIIGDDMYFFNSSGDLRKRSDTRLDVATAISAFYASGWWNMGRPSLKKKFTNFVLLSTAALKWLATIKTQIDWDSSRNITDSTIQMDTDIHIENRKLAMGKAYALRFIIENNIQSEKMLISGYEFEWESGQTNPKGND